MAYIVSPFTTFADTDGSPLNNGYVYIGTANLNPITNPISVYWDDALTQPAAQPLRTLNGFFSRSGTPARVYTAATNFSMVVNDNKGELVYSSLTVPPQISQSDIDAGLALKLNLTGGTMTGPIVLPGSPTLTLQATTKGYVDTADALKVNKAGDTMTGPLVLPGNPTADLQATTKAYVDSFYNQKSISRAWASFSGFPVTGTYSQSGTTITITASSPHGLLTSSSVNLTFTSGTAVSGSYVVSALLSLFIYQVQAVSPQTTSGNVTQNIALLNSFNFSSFSDVGVGQYRLTLSTPFPVGTVPCIVSSYIQNTSGNYINSIDASYENYQDILVSTSTVTSNTALTYRDVSRAHVVVYY
jgi:hypothetical protein